MGADTVTSHGDVARNPIQQIARRNSRSDVHIYTGHMVWRMVKIGCGS